MHHFGTPRTRTRSPDQCSISCQFTYPPPPPLQVRIMGCCDKRCQQVIMDTHKMCLHLNHMFKHLYDYGVTYVTILPLHASTMVFKVISINTHVCIRIPTCNFRSLITIVLASSLAPTELKLKVTRLFNSSNA